MLVKVKGDAIATISGRVYYGGQEVEVTKEQYEEVEKKVDVINTSSAKITIKKPMKENDNIETQEDK